MLKNGCAFAVAWLVLCGLASSIAEASSAIVPSGSPFIVDAWEAGPGERSLPQSSVIAITQTRDGYLWLGTLNGLVRFDGIRFTVFNEANTPGLDSSEIVYLFEDSQTNLWVGTGAAGIELIQNDGQIRNLGIGRGSREQRLKFVCEDSKGVVWLNTADGRVARYRANQLEMLNVGAGFLMVEKSGPLWLGTGQRLVAISAVPNSSTFIVKEDFPVGRLDYLLPGKNGGYWRLADGRVQKWRGGSLERDLGAYRWNPSRTRVTSACEDQQGNLIVGTHGNGVFWYDPNGRATQISTEQGLAHDSRNIVLSLCMDREGNLWVGTDGGGLNRVRRRVFGVLEESKDWTMQSICEDSLGGLWLGTFSSGLKYIKDGAVAQVGAQQGLTNLPVRTVFIDRNKRVLAGTDGYGLFQVADGLFRQFPRSEIASPFVSVIHQERNGRLWFGTQSGLVCWDGESWKTFTTRDGLSSDRVRAMADDAEGNIWIGTEGGGLNRLRDGRFSWFHKTNGLPSETISTLLEDAEGTLWMGTDGAGLVRLHQGKWTSYSKRDGLMSDRIGFLIEDAQGYLWMGSYAGLMRAPKKALNDFAGGLTNSVPCRAFGKSDGLPTSECTEGAQPAACRTRDGKLWFPTTKGLVSLDPAELKINTNQQPVIIESVLVEGQEQRTNLLGPRMQAITLPPGKERLEIHYASLNFSAPDNVRFKYRMEGHETDWTEAGNGRIARYSKLPQGHYRFRVIACNEDGVWNQTGDTLALAVLPPFWKTWWFLSVITVCVLGVMVAVVHYLSTQKLQRELAVLKQKEALEQERARIARDLHDQLGASLTQMALLGELAETDKNFPAEVGSHAQQISQSAREITRALDEIVWAVNPSNDTLEGLITYACKHAQEYLELAGVRCRLEVPSQLPDTPMPPEVRHNVYLAFKEAVNNVVKHAQASSVWIRLRLDTGCFTVEVEDDGRGLTAADEKGGRNGLRNMRQRMENVGGSFSIGPAVEQGTLVRLTAPI